MVGKYAKNENICENKIAPKQIVVLLFEQFSNHCLANAIEPLRAANALAGRALYDWQFVTLEGHAVTSSSGLLVHPEMRLSNHQGGDVLFVMSSYGYKTLANSSCGRAIRAAKQRFQSLVGMDTGAWLLAAAGVLDGRTATIHWDVFDEFAEEFPEVEVCEDRFVKDREFVTTGGVSTTFDYVLQMIENDGGVMLRLEVAAFFRHGSRSRIDDPLLRLTGHQKIDATVALMRRNLETPLGMEQIARQMRMPPRKLSALFQREIGSSPKTVYKRLRLREARRLIETSRFSIAEIGLRTGYQDSSAFTRAFRLEFGYPPRGVVRGT